MTCCYIVELGCLTVEGSPETGIGLEVLARKSKLLASIWSMAIVAD